MIPVSDQEKLDAYLWGLGDFKTPLALSEIMERWLDGYSQNTQETYTRAVLDFGAWLNLDPQALAHTSGVTAARDWALSMRNRGLSPNTMRTYYAALESLFEHARRLGHVPHNPFEQACVRLPSAKQLVRPQIALAPDEVARLFAAARNQKERAAFALAIGGCLRREELGRLTVDDLQVVRDPEGHRLVYLTIDHTKNGDPHQVAIPNWAADEVLAWLAERGDKPGLLVGKGAWVYKAWKRAVIKAGVRNCSPHAARDTCITQLLLQGKEMWEVAKVSNHKSVKSVERYFRVHLGVHQQASRDLIDLRGPQSETEPRPSPPARPPQVPGPK